MKEQIFGEWPDCGIAVAGGVPTLMLEGKPWFGWGVNRPFLKEGQFGAFEHMSGAGLRHFHCEGTCTEDIYHPELRFWIGPGAFDGTAQDRFFSRLAKIREDGLFQLRIYVGAPEWWLDAHPEECQRYHDGSVIRKLQAVGERRVPSVVSPVWREEACEAMRRYIGWLIESGWSKRVFAMFLSYGITWEWGLLGSDGYLDYSDRMLTYFREYLKRRYASTDKLSAAWGRELDFAGVEIPSGEKRGWEGGEMGIRPVPEMQDVIDFQQCLSEANADLLLALAVAVKEASGRKLLVGTAYGYTLTAREHSAFMGFVGAGGFQGGHHASGRVLRSPNIDFYVSPFNYADRTLGSGLLFEHVTLASVFAHGKAFMDENDNYTHTGAPIGDFRWSNLSIGIARNWEETLAYLRMAFGQAIVRGKHQWFAELAGWLGEFRENYSDPQFLAEVKRLNEAGEELVQRDRSPVTEVAFVIDEKSIAHLSLDHKGFLERVYRGSVHWGHAGAPFDLVLLEDLIEGGTPRYRLVVPACVKTRKAIEALSAWLERTGTPALWDGTREWYPPVENGPLIAKMEQAGVHRYVMEEVTVWANASMVLVHVGPAGVRRVRFRGACNGVELFSGKDFAAPGGECDWSFGENGAALFLPGFGRGVREGPIKSREFFPN